MLFLNRRKDQPQLMECSIPLPCITLVDPTEGADSVLAPGAVREALNGAKYTSVESFLAAVGGPKGGG